MRRRRRNRSTWFPILGFDTGVAANVNGLSTVDFRAFAVPATGAATVVPVPLIPDIDVPAEQAQSNAGKVETTLRDYVEGQSCIIDRIVGNLQIGIVPSAAKTSSETIICCAAIAVLPVEDDATGVNLALSIEDIDPLRADNSAQPWLWRRVWVLGDEKQAGNEGHFFPQNNLFGSVAEASKIDTKGTKRAIRREQRIFMVYSFLNANPNIEGESRTVACSLDVRVLGRMTRAHNRSTFK